MTGRLVRLCVTALSLGVLVPTMAFAQISQGSGIAGVVKDTSGAVMPGVTVEAASPVLIEKVRTAVTDSQGLYNIVNLRPGTYTITFTLPGFATVKREDLDLPAAFTATVNADLRVGGVEETITVSGQAPQVDLRSVTSQRMLSSELVETLPATRTSAMTAYAPMVPGMTGGLGLQSVASTSMSIHGSVAGEANLTIDGFPVRVIFTMQSYYWPNQATVQEVVVQTDGQTPESQLGGVWMNTIPKEGSNRFAGNLFTLYADHNMQQSNLTDSLRALGLTSVNSVDREWEVSPGLGGPILQDKLWFYAAYQQNPTRQIIANNYFNLNPRGWTYVPDLTRPAYIQIRNYSKELRLTWQASPKNKVNLSYDHTPHYTDERSFNSLVSPEATSYSPYLPMIFYTGLWRSTVTNKLLVEVGYGGQASNIDNRRQFHDLDQEVGYDILPARDANKNYFFRSAVIPGFTVANCTCVTYGAGPQEVRMARASASYITGSHAFKGGMSFVNGWSQNSTQVNGSIGVVLTNGVPSSMSLFATPYEIGSTVNYDLGFFAQDQWTLKRFTFNYGIRYDSLNASADAVDLPATRFVPARHYDKVDNVPNWKDITPRLGAVYDLFGTGKTALKVSLGKFVNFEATSLANASHGVTRSINSATRTWTDNGNFIPECDFSNPNAQDNRATGGDVCGRLSNFNFGSTNPNATTFDPAVMTGWGARPYNWSASGQIDHQLRDGISVSVGYFRRWFGNFRVNDNTFVTPADFSPFDVVAPIDPRLPNGISGSVITGGYDVSVAKAGQSQSYTTKASNFGKQTQVFDGVDITTNIRARGGVTLNGGVSVGRTATSSCFVIDSPQMLQYCDVKPPFQPNIKFNTLYTLPWYGIQTALVYQNLPGSAITASYQALNSEVRGTLGRDLSSGANGQATVALIAPNSYFGERVSKLDFRVLKSVNVGRSRLQGTLQIFNILNSSDVQTYNTTYGTAASHATWRQPTLVLQGRYFQVTGQVSF